MRKLPGIISVIVLFFGMASVAAAATGDEMESPPVPKVFFPEKVFQFAPVLESQEVTHDFIVKNQGKAELLIKRVKPGWGCTAASYTRQIPPGGEGKISIKVNTSGRGGPGPLRKKIAVFTNDTATPKQYLTITGKVDKLYTLSPRRVRLVGTLGAELKQTVKLTTEEKYPLSLLAVHAKNGENIRYRLGEVKEGNITRYELVVENLRKDVGRFTDTIFLKTDNKIQPEIRIPVYGNVKAPPDNRRE